MMSLSAKRTLMYIKSLQQPTGRKLHLGHSQDKVKKLSKREKRKNKNKVFPESGSKSFTEPRAPETLVSASAAYIKA